MTPIDLQKLTNSTIKQLHLAGRLFRYPSPHLWDLKSLELLVNLPTSGCSFNPYVCCINPLSNPWNHHQSQRLRIWYKNCYKHRQTQLLEDSNMETPNIIPIYIPKMPHEYYYRIHSASSQPRQLCAASPSGPVVRWPLPHGSKILSSIIDNITLHIYIYTHMYMYISNMDNQICLWWM
jgi:hypothetical protein